MRRPPPGTREHDSDHSRTDSATRRHLRTSRPQAQPVPPTTVRGDDVADAVLHLPVREPQRRQRRRQPRRRDPRGSHPDAPPAGDGQRGEQRGRGRRARPRCRRRRDAPAAPERTSHAGTIRARTPLAASRPSMRPDHASPADSSCRNGSSGPPIECAVEISAFESNSARSRASSDLPDMSKASHIRQKAQVG